MASLKQDGRRRGFSEGRFQATDWLSRGALFKRAFPSLPLAGATDTSFFFLCVWFSAVAVRLCAPAFAIFFHAIEMPGDSRLKPSTQRAFGSRKKRAWNKKAPATSAPSAAELESRPDPLDLPGTSTDDTVGPSSTSETLRVDAAYYSTAEQAQRVERSAQTKTVLSGKSATQRKFDLLGVSAECQTGDAGTDFLLVDMKVLNNFFAQAKCDKCDAKSLSVRKATDKEYGLAPQDEGYTDWLATHECQRNIECNSGHMEVEAALTMFQRSWAKHGLRYTTRMGAALRNLVDKKKAQGESLGGRGKLTQEKIKKIANYYGYALRSNINDVPAMKRAVEATLLHMTSTDDAPKHSKCPEGASSWCKYNRALANGESPPSHKNALPACVGAALEPVFARLSDESLLARCCEGKTQNASESLHSVIWTQTSKNGNASLESVKRAAAEAVAIYNQGRRATNESIAASLGYIAGDCLVRRSLEKDSLRLRKANATHLKSTNTKKTLARRHKTGATEDYSPGLL
ncbi:hypothetical protein HPB52_013659 [Rhipicephalus sanguineus]|uniref:Mutator-like transposase domain-containing protein n=1 Tax=Rhipicephalus sanguineus TaxID=34632 RepID=A0A9D4PGP9_RHISA|nr:hypothetical protein HPB52_013659 [Rhipicephalus sanguineus]